MDHVVEPTVEVADAPDEIEIADAIAMFNEAFEKSEHDWEAAEELFAKSFDGMVELARSGDTDAQDNVARMYGMGINEPYDEDIEMLNEWLWNAEEDMQTFYIEIEKHIKDIEARHAEPPEESHHDSDASSAHNGLVDHDKDARKLRRLYMLKNRLEKLGFQTGANMDEYHDPDAD